MRKWGIVVAVVVLALLLLSCDDGVIVEMGSTPTPPFLLEGTRTINLYVDRHKGDPDNPFMKGD